MLQKTFTHSAFFVIFVILSAVGVDLKGQGVCYTYKNVSTFENVTVDVDYETYKYKESWFGFGSKPEIKLVCCRQEVQQKEVIKRVKESYCCSGYRKESDICIPQCSKPCLNGECIKPEICKCQNGYKLKSKYECEPICQKTCIHGICVAPETCECLNGYKFKGNSEEVCEPFCSNGCSNGDCVAPEKCICFPGYEMRNNTCVLIENVVNDEPIVPCKAGYQKNNKTDACDPVCFNCINGKCTKPTECICNEGYKKSGNKTCIPACSNKCINGYCSEPDKCTCFEGYAILNASDPFYCQPVCKPSCQKGLCVAPGNCSCFSPQLGNVCINNTSSMFSALTKISDIQQGFFSLWTAIPVLILIIVTVALKVHTCSRRRRRSLLNPSKNEISLRVYTSDEFLLDGEESRKPVTYL